ncbi:MAG: adenosylcobinamide-GDP ribazoletransferase [Rikenellaceae bacterium]
MNTLLNAILFYSRLPVPRGVECSDETMSRALRYLPLIGLMVGALGWGSYAAAINFLPHNICIIISMIVMTLSTGALHEDGLADMCDGFGGGYTKEAILRIMKDSHIGTYGVIGLLLTLLLKYMLLVNIAPESAGLIILLGSAASRFAPVAMVRTSTYARSERSKSSHSALGISFGGVLLAMATAYLPLTILGWEFATTYIGISTFMFVLFRCYIHRHIGGFTGDTLGALQQISELIFYICIIAMGI